MKYMIVHSTYRLLADRCRTYTALTVSASHRLHLTPSPPLTVSTSHQADGSKEVAITLFAVTEDVQWANVSWNYRLINYDDDQLLFSKPVCNVYEGSNNSCSSRLSMNELPLLPSLSSVDLSLDYSDCASMVTVAPATIPALGGTTTSVDFSFRADEDDIDNPDR
jgi:hypothetical protein